MQIRGLSLGDFQLITSSVGAALFDGNLTTHDDSESTFSVWRFYASPREAEQLATGLTLAEAQEWCCDPESSSSTCTTAIGRARTAEYGDWFEGYREE